MLTLAMAAEIGEPWRSAVADLLDALDDARWLGTWIYCAPVALGIDERLWFYMTDTQRCDVVVAHARRLRVPRRA